MSETIKVKNSKLDGTVVEETFCKACLRSLWTGDECNEHCPPEEEDEA